MNLPNSLDPNAKKDPGQGDTAVDILRGTSNPIITYSAAEQLQHLLIAGQAPGEHTLNVSAMIRGLQLSTDVSHTLARRSGWWAEYDAMPEQYRKYFVVTKLMLCVSELSESMEGYRKSINDDHLPHREMFEVELADALIRIFDLAGALGLDLASALIEKLVYNQHRADHKPENRAAPGGKQV